MSDPIQWRIDYAKDLCYQLASFDQPHTILIGGSVAKGWADHYSDLELCFIWDKLPSLDQRQSFVEHLGGQSDRLKAFDLENHPLIIEDSFDIGAFHIDLWHCQNEGVENDIQEIVKEYNIKRPQGTLYTVQRGIILKDSDQLADWRNKISYPQGLRARYVQEHLSVIVKPDLLFFAQRNDLMMFYGLISGIQKRIIHILHGLNGVYFQGLKNTKHVLDSLLIKPKNCWKRFGDMYQLSIRESTDAMTGLIRELMDLIEKHLPDVAVTKLRSELSRKRRVKQP